jgi:hypothetical protein
MSKTMQWAWDKAEEKLETTIDRGFETITDVIDYMVDEVDVEIIGA